MFIPYAIDTFLHSPMSGAIQLPTQWRLQPSLPYEWSHPTTLVHPPSNRCTRYYLALYLLLYILLLTPTTYYPIDTLQLCLCPMLLSPTSTPLWVDPILQSMAWVWYYNHPFPLLGLALQHPNKSVGPSGRALARNSLSSHVYPYLHPTPAGQFLAPARPSTYSLLSTVHCLRCLYKTRFIPLKDRDYTYVTSLY